MRLTKYQYKRLQADIGGLTTLYAIIKTEKNKEKEPKPRVRFRFLLAEREGFEPPEAFTSTVFKFYPASVACRLLVLFNSPNCRKISVLTALLSDNSGFLLCFSIVPRSLLLLIFNAFLTAFCRWFVDE